MKNKCLAFCFAVIFILTGCSSTSKNDPWEGYNRFMYKTNKVVDRYTLKPLAKGYKAIMPDFAEKGVSNFFDNLLEFNYLVNNLLQGKFRQAGLSSSRLVWNSTLGLGGFIDVASGMGIEADKEDLGQTFRAWGIPKGPYFVIPVLGPSTVTDTVGLIGDFYISPTTYWDWTDYRISNGVYTLAVIDIRARLLAVEDALDDVATIDEYTFIKNSYLQVRDTQTRDGKADPQVEKDFDALFEENSRVRIR